MTVYTYYDWDVVLADLEALLVAHPDGLDIYDLSSALGMNEQQTRHAIHKLRRSLGANGTQNIIVRTQGLRWLYVLTDDHDDTRDYGRTRRLDLLTRNESLLAVWRSKVRDTDGRTLEGREARHQVADLEQTIRRQKIELGLVP